MVKDDYHVIDNDSERGFQWILAFEAYGVDSDPDSAKIHHDQTGNNLEPRMTAVLIGKK